MRYNTINRQEIIDLFHELMQPDSQFRILRLTGEAKIGKSHLLTKIFPKFAQRDFQARCAVIDLRSQALAVPDILHNACSQLGDHTFPGYHAAYQEWIHCPNVQVSGLQSWLSHIKIRSEGEIDEGRKVARHLVAELVEDLRNMGTTPMLFLFDAVEKASETMQSWLMDKFLVQLSRLTNVRTVVAGRSVPEANGSYIGVCRNYKLLPVRDEEEYISFCSQIGARLAEQSVRDIASLCDYKPGLFIDFVQPKLREGEANHD